MGPILGQCSKSRAAEHHANWDPFFQSIEQDFLRLLSCSSYFSFNTQTQKGPSVVCLSYSRDEKQKVKQEHCIYFVVAYPPRHRDILTMFWLNRIPDRNKLFTTNSPQKQAGMANPLHTVVQNFRSEKRVMIIKRLLFAFNYFPTICHQPALQI